MQPGTLTRTTTLLLAACTGLLVANIYYIQPLVPLVAEWFGITEAKASEATYLTQAGYAVGLILLVPLGDMLPRKKQILVVTLLALGCLLGIALSPGYYWLLVFCFFTGFFSTVPQMIIPLAATLSAPEKRGQTVGTVMSGLLIGILLSRALSGAVGNWLGWQAMFFIAALICGLLWGFMYRILPATHPSYHGSYGSLMGSLLTLLREEPLLRISTAINACCFAVFGGFWTAMVLLMHEPPHRLNASQIGLFGIAAALGALGAPLFGKIGDRRGPARTIGLALGIYVFALALLWGSAYWLPGFVVGIVVLDLAQQAVHVSNQTRIYALRPEARNRLNTVFMGGSFIGTATGSAVAVMLWKWAAWNGVMTGLALLAMVALLIHFGFARKTESGDKSLK